MSQGLDICTGCETPRDCDICMDLHNWIMEHLDAVPAVHAHWYFTEYEYFDCSACGESYYTGAECSAEARERLKIGKFYNYCPHCGARMDEEVQHGDQTDSV